MTSLGEKWKEWWDATFPAPQPRILTPDEIHLQRLKGMLGGLSYKNLVYLQGLAQFNPNLIPNPDEVTAHNLAIMQMCLGAQEWAKVAALPPSDIIRGCAAVIRFHESVWMS